MNVKHDATLRTTSYSGDDSELLPTPVRDEYESGDFYSMREKRRGMRTRKRRRCTANIGIETIDGEDEAEGYKSLSKNSRFEMSLPMALEHEMKYKRSGSVGRPTTSDGSGFSLDFRNLSYKMNSATKFHNRFSGPCFEDLFRKREPRGKRLRIELTELIEHVVATVRMFTSLVHEKVKVGRSKGDHWKEMHIKEDSGKRKERRKKVIDYLAPSSSSSSSSSTESSGQINSGSSPVSSRENQFTKIDRRDFVGRKYWVDGREISVCDSVTVLYGNIEFTYPLVALVIRIAGAACRYTSMSKGPVGVNMGSGDDSRDNEEDEEKAFEYRSYPEMQMIDSMQLEKGIATETAKRRRFGARSALSSNSGPTAEYIPEPDHRIYGPMVRYVRDFLCSGDLVSFTLVETWLAEMFFDPGTKYPICPVFVGPETGGKTLFFEVLRDHVLGEALTYFADFTGELGYLPRSFSGRLLVVGTCKTIDRSRCPGQWNKFEKIVRICSEGWKSRTGNQCDDKSFERSCILADDLETRGFLSPGDNSVTVIRTNGTGKFILQKIMEEGKMEEVVSHYVGYLGKMRGLTKDRFAPGGDLSGWTRPGSDRRPIGVPEKLIHPDISRMGTCYEIHEVEGKSRARCIGYDTGILIKRPMTSNMRSRAFDHMKPYHNFLYLFLIRKLPLSSLVSGDFRRMYIESDKTLRVGRRDHELEVGDLRAVGMEYFENACKTFVKSLGVWDDPRNTGRVEYCGVMGLGSKCDKDSRVDLPDLLTLIREFAQPYNEPVKDLYDIKFRLGKRSESEEIGKEEAKKIIETGIMQPGSKDYMEKFTEYSLETGDRSSGMFFVTPDGVNTTRSATYGIFRKDIRGLTGEEIVERYYNLSGVSTALMALYGGEYGFLKGLEGLITDVGENAEVIEGNSTTEHRGAETKPEVTVDRSKGKGEKIEVENINDDDDDEDVQVTAVKRPNPNMRPGTRVELPTGQQEKQGYWAPNRIGNPTNGSSYYPGAITSVNNPVQLGRHFEAFGASMLRELGKKVP